MSLSEAHLARSVSPGSFLIPAIDPEIPVSISQSRRRQQVLARLAKATAAKGFPLPQGTYTSIEDVIREQWTQLLKGCLQSDVFANAPAAPTVVVTDDHLQVVIGSVSQLSLYRLKPVVEKLEAAAPGLGWFVHKVLESASYHGHELYDMRMVAYLLDMHHSDMDEFTDEAYARAVLAYEGEIYPKGPIPPEVIEGLREQYSFWPSALLEAVDGHAHLLHWGAKNKSEIMSASAARKWLSSHKRSSHAPVVSTALQLYRAFKKDKDRAFVWNGGEDETETVGALGFVAWNDPGTLLEAVQHHEEMVLNAGQCEEAFARCRLPLDENLTDAHLRKFVSVSVDYFNRWGLLAKLLSHFPTWESDDET